MSSKLNAEKIELVVGDYLIELHAPKYIYRVQSSETDTFGCVAVAKRLSGDLHGYEYRVHNVSDRLYLGTIRIAKIDAFEAELLLLKC